MKENWQWEKHGCTVSKMQWLQKKHSNRWCCRIPMHSFCIAAYLENVDSCSAQVAFDLVGHVTCFLSHDHYIDYRTKPICSSRSSSECPSPRLNESFTEREIADEKATAKRNQSFQDNTWNKNKIRQRSLRGQSCMQGQRCCWFSQTRLDKSEETLAKVNRKQLWNITANNLKRSRLFDVQTYGFWFLWNLMRERFQKLAKKCWTPLAADSLISYPQYAEYGFSKFSKVNLMLSCFLSRPSATNRRLMPRSRIIRSCEGARPVQASSVLTTEQIACPVLASFFLHWYKHEFNKHDRHSHTMTIYRGLNTCIYHPFCWSAALRL